MNLFKNFARSLPKEKSLGKDRCPCCGGDKNNLYAQLCSKCGDAWGRNGVAGLEGKWKHFVKELNTLDKSMTCECCRGRPKRMPHSKLCKECFSVWVMKDSLNDMTPLSLDKLRDDIIRTRILGSR